MAYESCKSMEEGSNGLTVTPCVQAYNPYGLKEAKSIVRCLVMTTLLTVDGTDIIVLSKLIALKLRKTLLR